MRDALMPGRVVVRRLHEHRPRPRKLRRRPVDIVDGEARSATSQRTCERPIIRVSSEPARREPPLDLIETIESPEGLAVNEDKG